MARKSRTAVLKRQREAKKAEKASMKREKREIRAEDETGGQVATTDDLAGYGFAGDEDDAVEEPSDGPPRSPSAPIRPIRAQGDRRG
ncbi:MAG: hypothetical protein JRH16_04165 [Deltaproteobacteria bacterium]|nr:hypothetical protein [Deltaproteobacteria bacterium]MBW2359831.1 hypothetical protein [Deltaproteobacteria bacterium]